MTDSSDAPRIDLTKGVAANSISPGGMISGRVGDDDVVLARSGDRLLRRRRALHALSRAARRRTGRRRHGALPAASRVFQPADRRGAARAGARSDRLLARRAPGRDGVRAREADQRRQRRVPPAPPQAPSSVVIVGGGAAGLAAADMLRREGYDGPVTMISADADAPVDRPNLSKDYLAGEAQDDWIPLWPPEFYARAAHRAACSDAGCRSIDSAARTRRCSRTDRDVTFGALLIATGADPVRLPIPGADGPQVHYLRSFADSRAIVERAAAAKHVVVVGASFIGLEVAASLRARGIAVDVVAPESVPLERVMGAEVGRFVQSLHEAHGVVFHLGRDVDGGRRPDGDAERRRDARRRFRRDGRRRPAGDCARRAGRARRSIAASPSTSTSKPARPASSPPATSRAGPIRTPASASASSTGSSPSVRARSPRATCSAGASGSTPCRSSGASTTT